MKQLVHLFLVTQLLLSSIAHSDDNVRRRIAHKFDQEVEKSISASVEQVNKLLNTNDKTNFKKTIQDSLKNESDKLYLDHYFDSKITESFKSYAVKYKNGEYQFFKNNKVVAKINEASPFTTKLQVNGKAMDLADYQSLKDLVTAFEARLTSPAHTTFLQQLQRIFLIEDAHASVMATLAIIGVVSTLIIVAGATNASQNMSCGQRISLAIEELEKMKNDCNNEKENIANIEWTQTVASKVLRSSQSLPFKIDSKSSSGLSCTEILKNNPEFTYRSAWTLFITKKSCVSEVQFRKFCGVVEDIKFCVEKSLKEHVRLAAIEDDERSVKEINSTRNQKPAYNSDGAKPE